MAAGETPKSKRYTKAGCGCRCSVAERSTQKTREREEQCNHHSGSERLCPDRACGRLGRRDRVKGDQEGRPRYEQHRKRPLTTSAAIARPRFRAAACSGRSCAVLISVALVGERRRDARLEAPNLGQYALEYIGETYGPDAVEHCLEWMEKRVRFQSTLTKNM